MKKILITLIFGILFISAASLSSASFVKSVEINDSNDSSGSNNTGGNNPPSVSISGPSEGEVGNSYMFSASCSDPDGDMLSYTFSNGDSGTCPSGGSAYTSISWDEEGTYTVSITVSDGNGGTASDSTTITIEDDEDEDTTSVTTNNVVVEDIEYDLIIPNLNINTQDSNYEIAVLTIPEGYTEDSSGYSSSTSSSTTDSNSTSSTSSSSSDSTSSSSSESSSNFYY